MTTQAAYGSWASPISARSLTTGSVSYSSPQVTAAQVYWLESRPTEQGRLALCRMRDDGTVAEVLPADCNVRSRVHEYGGGAYLAVGDERWFSNDSERCIWYQQRDHAPVRLTTPGKRRYADFTYDAQRQRIIGVCEDHTPSGEPENFLVALDARSPDQQATVLTLADDFYSTPRISADGKQLCWLSWQHPHMPWDSTRLWCADIDDDGGLEAVTRIAGGDAESVFQPSWGKDGTLYFASDRSGWWNLYRHHHGDTECLWQTDAEFALPQWVFGMSTYVVLDDGRLCAASNRGGNWQLNIFDAAGEAPRVAPLPFCDISSLVTDGTRVVFLAASKTSDSAVYALDTDSLAATRLSPPDTQPLAPAYISQARAITFPTGNGTTAHGFYYPPTNPDFVGPAGSAPPLLVKIHGGPSAATTPAYNAAIQYWTSRGFALFDINYRGSTGHGRAYRKLLDGQWGIADVEDCVHGARYLAEQGLADAAKLAIRGSSAGGFTTLAALTFHDTFSAGCSLYGISDLKTLAEDTHKFEARYLDSLIAPWPDGAATYAERSPINHVAQLSAPLLLLQGLEDKVVPPAQAEAMRDALLEKGIPVAYIAFAGEQHGFRQADTIQRALEAELSFYAQVFGFTPADDIATVAIQVSG